MSGLGHGSGDMLLHSRVECNLKLAPVLINRTGKYLTVEELVGIRLHVST